MNPIVITLVLVLQMPGHQPDVMYRMSVDSEAECEQLFHEWFEKGLTEAEKAVGAVGVGGGCYSNKPSVDINESEHS